MFATIVVSFQEVFAVVIVFVSFNAVLGVCSEDEPWRKGGGEIYIVINEEYSSKIFIIKSMKNNNNQSIYREKNINYNACLNYKWMPIVKFRLRYPAVRDLVLLSGRQD